MLISDQDFEMILIDGFGIFEWKVYETAKEKKNRRKDGTLIEETIDKTSVYNTLIEKANIQNKNVNQMLVEDRRNRLKDDMISQFVNQQQNTVPSDIPIPPSLSMTVHQLFEMVDTLKKNPNSAFSILMKDINISREGDLLVISSKNEKLLSLFIQKIASFGIFPVNSVQIPDSEHSVIHKFYYGDDSNMGAQGFDG